jgi:hypothetical protein
MNEEKRLEELKDYKILDTESEVALDEFVEIASCICDTPVSLISLVDDSRQWFKAKKGLAIGETHRKLSFCQYTIDKPKEVLVVNDSLRDSRFSKNPLVTGDPKIRFYAGAPLETPEGNVLGTICVIDNKPRKISERKKVALKLLARKVMDYLNSRKVLLEQRKHVRDTEKKLKKLTDQVSGVIFQFRITEKGVMFFDFLSKGIIDLSPSLNPKLVKKNPQLVYQVIHQEDLPRVKKSIRQSYHHLSEWDTEFRVITENDDIKWHLGKAKPKKENNGDVVWYGTFQDITEKVEYRMTLEQIAFDISHILRKPVTNMIGLTKLLIEGEHLTPKKIKAFVPHIKAVSEELDQFTRRLNDAYQIKKKNME